MPPRKEKDKQDDKYSLEPAKPGKAKGLYTDFEEALRRERKAQEKEKKEEKPPLFLRVTRWLYKRFKSYGKGAKFTDEEAQEFAFIGWDITAEEFYAAYKSLLIVGLALGLVIGGALYFMLSQMGLGTVGILFAGLFVAAPLAAGYVYKNYPKSVVEREKMLSLAYIPEIVNYLTMSMRLTSNLEQAVAFAANHGQGKIAEDLKKIVWDVQIGRYGSIEEGLDDLAYKWGDYNEDFKQALMIIRASVLEGNAQRREELLEKASADVLEGTREKMDLYARKLQQPTVYLYYFGILLPLLLAIILPIGGSMTGLALAKPEYLFVGYNILIPLMVFAFGSMIVAGKPPTYTPPKIPYDFPGLPPRGQSKVLGIRMPFKWFAVLLVVGLVALGYYADQGLLQDTLNGVIVPFNDALVAYTGGSVDLLGGAPGITISGTLGQIPAYETPGTEGYAAELTKIPHLTWFYSNYGLFVGQFTIFGALLGVALATSMWLNGEYGERKKAQDEIRAMEGEFKDALYVLASRLGENKPIEEALKNATEFLPKSKVSNRVFKRVLQNITTMGMTLDSAVFDKTFGAMKDLPSRTIQSGMQFLVGSIDLGVNVAAKSLINLAMQLRNSQKIDQSLKLLLQDVTTMLGTMATFVAPIVLAVVSAMQRLIVNSLTSAGGGEQQANTAGAQGFGLSSMFNNQQALADMADPATFIAIMGVYVIEVVVLLTYFNSQIEETNNELHTYTSIAKTLPLAVFLYCVVVYFASATLGGG